MKRCVIVAAGEMGGEEISLDSSDILIAADAGYNEIVKRGLKPNYVVGDFDSLGRVPEGENVVKHPVMKDDTDTMLAVKIGLSKDCTEFLLYGALGGRLDHTFANIQTLSYIADNGARGYIIAEDCCVTAIKNGCLSFTDSAKGIVSVFSTGFSAKGVNLEGLLYPLTDYTLTNSVPLGVRNEFTGKPSRVSVEDGTLVVMFDSFEYIDRGDNK